MHTTTTVTTTEENVANDSFEQESLVTTQSSDNIVTVDSVKESMENEKYQSMLDRIERLYKRIQASKKP